MQNLLLVNILLALVWAAVSSSFTVPNLLFGFMLGMIVLFILREQVGAFSYLGRARRVLSLLMLFLRELMKSAFRVAKLALSPKLELRPGFIAYDLTTDRDIEITILANMITLTPGTLSVDVSDDKKTLYIHAVTFDDLEELRSEIRDGFERKIMEAFR
ncbi:MULTISPECIES: Na+/H+ antiporter subunit E [Cohaesibacter]|uniref:Na+/H+ antiporter subunit E n=1 Tax=Cohaesibacter TaxID=655352 RepID=UPI000DE9893B|nr:MULTISPECIES: Na+/H+ antiporter subunit E [Cohaesibacter]TLP44843.1 Na+/H+ antiporter subunit E [Cohaesibacter sp. CAU 1516]